METYITFLMAGWSGVFWGSVTSLPLSSCDRVGRLYQKATDSHMLSGWLYSGLELWDMVSIVEGQVQVNKFNSSCR